MKRKRICIIAILLVLVFSSFSLSEVYNGNDYQLIDGVWYRVDGAGRYQVRTDVLIVKFKTEAIAENINAILEKENGRIRHRFRSGWFTLEFPGITNPVERAKTLQNLPLIEDVNLDEKAVLHSYPNDPLFLMPDSLDPDSGQWYLQNPYQDSIGIDAGKAWDHLRARYGEVGSSDVVIAVIEESFWIEHPDICDNLWANPNEIPDNSVDDDGNGYIDDYHGFNFIWHEHFYPFGLGYSNHGTAVAGLIAAQTNNGIGIASAAGPWTPGAGIKIMALCGIYESEVSEAVEYAVDMGADVINMSFGWDNSQPLLEDELQEADSHGIILVASVGNAGTRDIAFPAYMNEVIAVGMTNFKTYDIDRACEVRKVIEPGQWPDKGSNYGGGLDIMAAGNYMWMAADSVYIKYLNYQYRPDYYDTYRYFYARKYNHANFAGTSWAAPQVSAVAALIRSHFPDMSTPQDVKRILFRSAEKLQGLSGYYGLNPKTKEEEEQVYDYNDDTSPDYGAWDEQMGFGRLNAFYAVAPPDAPTGLYITGSGGQHPTLHWNAPEAPDIENYIIKRVTIELTDSFTVSGSQTSWTDNLIIISRRRPRYTVTYSVAALDYSNQWSSFSNSRSVGTDIIPASGDEVVSIKTNIPNEFEVLGPSPNPFNASTTIRFGLPETGQVRFDVYDIQGRHIATLLDEERSLGWHTVSWNAADVPSGTYFLLTQMGSQIWNHKLVVVK